MAKEQYLFNDVRFTENLKSEVVAAGTRANEYAGREMADITHRKNYRKVVRSTPTPISNKDRLALHAFARVGTTPDKHKDVAAFSNILYTLVVALDFLPGSDVNFHPLADIVYQNFDQLKLQFKHVISPVVRQRPERQKVEQIPEDTAVPPRKTESMTRPAGVEFDTRARRQAESLLRQSNLEAIVNLPGLESVRMWYQRFGSERQHRFHEYTVGAHVNEVVRGTQKRTTDVVTILAAVLHDIGKEGAARSQQLGRDPQGRGREPKHTERSTKLSREILKKVNWLNEEEKQQVLFLVEYHEHLGNLAVYKYHRSPQKQNEVYKGKGFNGYLQEVVGATTDPEIIDKLMILTQADIAGIKRNEALLTKESLQNLKAARHEILANWQLLNARSAEGKKRQEMRFDSAFHKQMGRIERREALGNGEPLFSYPAPTHRCNAQAAMGILETGIMYSSVHRGVNFRVAGLSADYGFITFIGKADEARFLDPNAPDPANIRSKHPYNIFDLAGVDGESKATDLGGHFRDIIYAGNGRHRVTPNLVRASNKKVNDWHDKAEVPAADSAQLNIGIRDAEKQYYWSRITAAAQKMGRSPDHITGGVPTEALRAMIIPKFYSKTAEGRKLMQLAGRRGLNVLISDSGETVLDYMEEALKYYLDRSAVSSSVRVIDAMGPMVAEALSQRYGQQVTYDYFNGRQYDQFRGVLHRYLRETGKLPHASSYNYRDIVRAEVQRATDKGMSRGSYIGGTYLNTVGEKAYLAEQEVYFKHLAATERAAQRAKYKI